MHFFRDQRYLISGCNDGSIILWDLDSGSKVATLPAHGDAVLACGAIPGRTWALSAGRDKKIAIWDLEAQAQVGAVRNVAVTWC